MTTYEIPSNKRPLETMYAYVSEDSEGRHGILSSYIAGRNFPMVTSEKSLAEVMRTTAKKVQTDTGIKVKFVTLKVVTMEDI